MDHQPIGFNRKVPQVELDPPQLHAAARSVLQNLHNLPAHPPIEIIRSRIPRERPHQHHQQHHKSNHSPRHPAPHPRRQRPLHRGDLPRDPGLELLLFLQQFPVQSAHGVTSPCVMICTLPCARSGFSQSCNSAPTSCCNSTS